MDALLGAFVKIIHFLYDCPENPWLGGGGAVRAQEINKRLVKKGHEVHMICGAFPGRFHADWIVDGVHWHSCGSAGDYAVSRLLFSVLCRRRIKSIGLPDPDLIVEDISPFSAIFSSWVWKGPRVTIVQNWMGHKLQEKFGILGVFFGIYEKRLLAGAKRIIAVSQSLEKQIKAVGISAPIDVVYNGIQDSFFEYSTEDVKIEPNTFLYVGRIEIYQKGIDILLEGFAEVVRVIPEAKLWVVGTGKDQAKFEAMIKARQLENSVVLYGRLQEDRIQIMAKASILVMPSRFESWGIVAMEAAALGKPVIASNIPGLNEAVVDGETGVLFDGGGMATQMISLIQDLPRIQMLGTNAKSRSFHFRWNELSAKQEARYSSEILRVGTYG